LPLNEDRVLRHIRVPVSVWERATAEAERRNAEPYVNRRVWPVDVVIEVLSEHLPQLPAATTRKRSSSTAASSKRAARKRSG